KIDIMRYIFKVLILSGNLDVAHFYTSRAFGEPGEDKVTYFEWYREVKIFEDTCDLEIDVITSIAADLDEIIPIVDGIIYFLNPLIKEEFELLEMVMPDIFSVKRDIPTIVIFYGQNGILPISVNELLTNLWVNYPSLEAFANLNPEDFHQALQSLCLAMINGETPLNIENAWMRLPIFIQMANVYFDNKNYYYAAQAVRKAAMIAEIYNKEEYFIMIEKAAYLYSKINLYLEASQILEDIDKRKSVNFKKLYVDAMIREGNLYFNKQEYETAAKQYERSGQWASIELLNKEIIDEAFKLAITSWISACKVENAFRILEDLSHQEAQAILKEVTSKIGKAAEFLVDTNKFELAKEQLYSAIYKYQRETLSDELEELTDKLTKILIDIFKHQVEVKEIHAARYTYDEIENMWESYDVKRTNLDGTLKILINLFLEKKNFGIATTLINKLNSLMLKQELTKFSGEIEDSYKTSLKKELEETIKKCVDILTEFAEAELEIISKMNIKKIKEANELIKQGKYLKGAKYLITQANYLKKIGREDIGYQILTRSLDILLEGNIFEEFFIIFSELSIEMKKNYLIRIFTILLDRLKEIEKLENFKRIAGILEDSIRIYRNHLLYEESKQICLVYIKTIKREALNLLQGEENLSGIRKANDFVKKAEDLSDAYLEKEESLKINYDKIFKKTAEIYIELDDLPNAHAYNDRIVNKKYKKEIHDIIDKLEAEKSAIRSKKAKETREEKLLEEKRSIIENKAGEYRRLDREKEIKERNARKTRYFRKALACITNGEYDKAIDLYKETIAELNRITKYNLAGVSLVIVSLLLLREDRMEEVRKILEETKRSLVGLGKLFSETFPVTLVEYILQAKKFKDKAKLNEALTLMEHLPLFDEEIRILHDSFSEDYRKVEKLENQESELIQAEKFKAELSKKQAIEIDQRYGRIESKLRDTSLEKEDFLNKRKATKRIFYNPIFKLLEAQNYTEAATKYYELAETMVSKRKDLKISSLLILLHGLCLLKANEPFSLIKASISQFLNRRGVNKKLIEDTYDITLILFIMDVKKYNLENYLPKISGMLEILPLFEEEIELIEDI
ncbi:MAG: hypothetical protein ACFFG0_33890, partial [Candidatus Thorarchaeota archaeon]